MSFWDHIKPAQRVPQATNVALDEGGAVVRIDWDDGKTTALRARLLRQNCPCAECVEEWSGRRTFDVATIPEGMKVLQASPVGNYALQFTFSDAHRTGIFNWGHLRELSAA